MQINLEGEPFSKPKSRRALLNGETESRTFVQTYDTWQSERDRLMDQVDEIFGRIKSNQKFCEAGIDNLEAAVSKLQAKQDCFTSLQKTFLETSKEQVKQGNEIRLLKCKLEEIDRIWLEGKDEATDILRRAEGEYCRLRYLLHFTDWFDWFTCLRILRKM